jgi:Fe2+ transport system protein FeoA
MSVTCLDLARSHGTSRLRVRDVPLADAPRQRLAEMGVRPGAEVSVVQRTSGGGVVVEVGGAHIALDRATARAITVEGS